MAWITEIAEYREALLKGLFVTLTLNVLVIVLGTLLSGVVAAARLSGSAILRAAGRVYVDLFRAIPLLVLLVWIFFALPLASSGYLRFEPFMAATIALTLNLSAFGAEIVRAGIQSVPSEHVAAARLAGISRRDTWRYISGPLALRTMLAPLTGLYINQIKLSVLASVIAVPELLHAVNTIASESFKPLIFYSVLAVLFVAVLVPLTLLQGMLEARFRSFRQSPERAELSEPQSGEGARLELLGAWPKLAEPRVLVARGIAVMYDDTIVVDGVSFDAAAGHVTGLLGGNGSGKSSLLKVTANVMRPHAGRIRLRKNGQEETPLGRLGYMPQNAEPWPHMTVLRNLTLPLRVAGGCLPVEAEQIGRLWLSAVGLGEYAGARADKLSGGQRQRLVLARLLCLKPAVLLLDEPTSALDLSWARTVYGLLRMVASRGAVVVAVSHAVSFVRDCADEIVFLHRGRVQACGPVDALLTAPEGEQLRSLLEAA